MTLKEDSRTIVGVLDQDLNRDDVLYESQIRQKIGNGIEAVKEERTLSHDAVKRMFSH